MNTDAVKPGDVFESRVTRHEDQCRADEARLTRRGDAPRRWDRHEAAEYRVGDAARQLQVGAV